MKIVIFAATTGILLLVGVLKIRSGNYERSLAYSVFPNGSYALSKKIKAIDKPEDEYYEYLRLIEPDFGRSVLPFWREFGPCDQVAYQIFGDDCNGYSVSLGFILSEELGSDECADYYVYTKKQRWNKLALQIFCVPFLELDHHDRLAVMLIDKTPMLQYKPVELESEILRLK